MRRAVLLAGLASVLFACRATRGAESEVKLVGGTPAAASEFPFALIWTGEDSELRESYCTGARVGKNLILTAAHCVLVQDTLPGQVYLGPWKRIPSMNPGRKIKYSFARKVDAAAETGQLTLKKLHLPPLVEKCLDGTAPASARCEYRVPIPDVALLEVTAPHGSPFAIAPLAQVSFDAVGDGRAITMMGYGAQAKNDTKPPTLKYYRTKVATRAELEAALQGTDATLDGFPDAANFYGTLGTLTGPGRANLGSGDSGGPVYDEALKAIVGVNSDGHCPVEDRAACQRTTNSIFARLPKAWLQPLLSAP